MLVGCDVFDADNDEAEEKVDMRTDDGGDNEDLIELASSSSLPFSLKKKSVGK